MWGEGAAERNKEHWFDNNDIFFEQNITAVCE
jgi:hypothetical protein